MALPKNGIFVGVLDEFGGVCPEQQVDDPVSGDLVFFEEPEWASVPAGPAGYVLQTNGVGVAPSWVDPGSASLPVATQVGQVLYSIDGSNFSVQLPLASCEGWLVNDQGIHIVVG